MIVPIVLQIVGVLVIIAEIILPSGGILSLLAIGLIGYSLYAVFTGVSTTAGIIFLAVDVVMLPVMIVVGLKLLARSPVTLRKSLGSADGVTSQSAELDAYTGRRGTASTDLRPSGVAFIEGQRVDVVTRGEYIEKETPVVVTGVQGNQIIVKADVMRSG